ncbi:MAG: glycerate kinase [Lachnospiraceae bacterium]|nr:glycerate kinase [Lachnospiraceae bacterium]
MRIVVAVDSFKGSMTSMEAGEAVRAGILRAIPEAEVLVRPLADGGEGTVEALIEGMGGERHTAAVTGPLGKPVECVYGMIRENKTAVLEMSGAAGLTLVPEKERNPLYATTYGVGEVIRAAMEKGCRRFLIGIGGSATNDGGVGMLKALGFRFLDVAGNDIGPGAAGLEALASISADRVLPELGACEFRVACDVTNGLCGPKGCSAVYGPQKGATPSMIAQMDAWLANYARIAKKMNPGADPKRAGSGAAGGLGFAFLAFLHAALEPGIQIVLEETRLEEQIREADFVVTGEGRLDMQTAMGKAPVGVAALAKKYGKPVIAFAGSVASEANQCNEKGLDAIFPILREITTLERAMEPEYAKNNLVAMTEQVFRLIKISK